MVVLKQLWRENLVLKFLPNKNINQFLLHTLEVALYLVTSFGLVQLLQYILLYFKLLPKDVALFNSLHIFTIAYIQACVFIFIFLAFKKVKKNNILFWTTIPSAWLYIKALFGMFLVNIVSSLLMLVLGIEVKQYESFNKDVIRSAPILFFIAVSILAPIYEEFIFRGFLLRYLYIKNDNLQNTKMWVIASVVSSLFFAAIHFDKDAFIPILFLSFYLSFVTVYTKSITLSTMLHISQNLLSSIVFVYVDIAHLTK